MQKKNLTRYLVWAVLLAAALWLFLVGCGRQETQALALPSASSLAKCELTIHNVTCPELGQARTCADDAVRMRAAELCAAAEPFRPIISTDLILGCGSSSDPSLTFRDGETRYVFTLFDAEAQLDLNSVHRDEPVLAVSAAGDNWYCILTPAEYAELYELAQTYTGGELCRD